jgi:hypothetical protein
MNGILYLIESVRDYETVYKIGYTRKSSKNRSGQLQTGNDSELKVIDEFYSGNVSQLEKAIHNFYSHAKIKNEWFKLDLKDVVKFKELCNKIENNINLIKNINI